MKLREGGAREWEASVPSLAAPGNPGRAFGSRGLRFGMGALVGVLSSAALGQAPPASIPLERAELEGAIAGRVCDDKNGDGRCGADEPGIGGATVVLETGQQAIADARGRYHLAGISARAPDRHAGGRLLPGRHRIRLDDRAFPRDTVVRPRAVVLEVPLVGLVLQDFAIHSAAAPVQDLQSVPEVQPPAGELLGQGRVRFLVTGQAAPGDRVEVAGSRAEVDERGLYRAPAELSPGSNPVAISATSPAGAVRLFVQRIDVVERAGGILVVPRRLEPIATVRLPAGEGERAATGQSVLRFSGLPGTRIRHPGGEIVLGEDGQASVPLELSGGENRVPLRLERPGQPPREEIVTVQAGPRPLLVGLLDLEGAFEPRRGLRALGLFGRGGAHLEQRIGKWQLAGELELRDQDLPDIRFGGPLALATARRPDRLERALDPEAYPVEWADDSHGAAPNSPEGRLRVELRHDEFGAAGFGTRRALFADSEVGRYQRELFGPYLDVKTPAGRQWQAGLSAFASPAMTDPTRELALAPTHDELRATGGSLYYLGRAAVSRGSEVARVEVRDGLTGVPLSERHLVRGRDYEIDYGAGRILLARPLSFIEGETPLPSEALTARPEPVLVVDYEALELAQGGRNVAGGEVTGSLGPVALSAGLVRERGQSDAYTLLRAAARAPLGPVTLMAEVAQSEGAAIAAERFGISDDGGLSFLRPPERSESGLALTLRAKGPGLSKDGSFDVAFRRRTPGFADGAHVAGFGLRQLSVRGEQRFGSFEVGALVDDRSAVDPRLPFSTAHIDARTLGASAGYRQPSWGVRLDLKDAEVTAEEAPTEGRVTGGRTSAGLSGHLRVTEQIRVVAGHKQVFAKRGLGLGRVDDSFSSAGVDLTVEPGSLVGLRAGFGPVLGPQIWGQAEVKGGKETWYGTYSVDVDGPHFGERRAVSGARTEVEEGTALFVEDVAAHDASAIRLARAVGLTQEVSGGFSVTGRFERGVRQPFDGKPSLLRNAGGVTASLVRQGARAFVRAELRSESGSEQLTPFREVSRLQGVFGLGGELQLSEAMRASLRGSYVHSANGGVLEARLLEGSVGVAWRMESAMLALRYAVERELLPRGGQPEKRLDVVSFLPSVRLGPRVSVAAGVHAGWSTVAENPRLVLSASLRPSVKVVGGLEVAAEVARRTSAPDGGRLEALRGELGYRFDERVMLAAGYSLLGFSGLGLSEGAEDNRDRFYLRAEVGY
ncbi:MAG: flagellar motor protein [Myxococcales bacterium]|nr:flagellar motor protein [Myxococcales bacterium]